MNKKKRLREAEKLREYFCQRCRELQVENDRLRAWLDKLLKSENVATGS